MTAGSSPAARSAIFPAKVDIFNLQGRVLYPKLSIQNRVYVINYLVGINSSRFCVHTDVT